MVLLHCFPQIILLSKVHKNMCAIHYPLETPRTLKRIFDPFIFPVIHDTFK